MESGRMRYVLGFVAVIVFNVSVAGDFERVMYNHPGLVTDLGVGLWAEPMPMDYDGDGDLDLVVSTADVPSNGTYFFENASGKVRFPVFKPGVRIAAGKRKVAISYVRGKPYVFTPGIRYDDFPGHQFEQAVDLQVDPEIYKDGNTRARQWKLCDYDGDGRTDVIAGIGVWEEYGWDDAYDEEGNWTSGPLHGYVYFLQNRGSDEEPAYTEPVKLEAGGKPVDVYGMPSPNFADFDGDGDLDLLCGSFVDRFTYFENTGTRTEPSYTEGRELTYRYRPLRVDLCMMVPVAIDWDGDGDTDLVVGEEDGRVSLMEHTGEVIEGMPQFLPPRYFQQEADALKFGALATPVSYDWDGDGDEDILSGNTAGYIGFIENLDGGDPPKWAAPVYLEADGEVIRIMAGKNGSIQGPAEEKWGYTVLDVADWDHDGLPDIVVNSIWGKVVWFRNRGSRRKPKLEAARAIEVDWPGEAPKPKWNWWDPKGKELVTQWRTTPFVTDLNHDGLNDLVMLDVEGFLGFYERVSRDGELRLLPPKRIFQWEEVDGETTPLRLNERYAGKSGRRKFVMYDWDGDGRTDLLVNSENIHFFRNVAKDSGAYVFKDMGAVGERKLAGHTTSPTTVDWDKDGKRDLFVGAEDGFFYLLKNPW